MPRKPESRGTCAYCGEVIFKCSVTKHLGKCPRRLEALQSAAASSRPVETLWHLRVQDAYDKDYWLELEMVGSVSLDKLDKYCCDEHVEDHPRENYGEPMPLFNSPRTGMCGYDRPAEPPY